MPYRQTEQLAEPKSKQQNKLETKPENKQSHHTNISTLASVGGGDGPPQTNTLQQLTNGRMSRAGNMLLQLQNQYGNQHVQRLINPQQRITVQPKLTLGDANTPSEREADQVANQVMRGQQATAPSPVRGPGTAVSPQTESAINQARGGGYALPQNTQTSMGQALGIDLSGIRVHTDSRADRLNQTLNAQAFTTGQDIFFRRGAYNPGSSNGQELIAHELTHVGQQQHASGQQQGNQLLQRKIFNEGVEFKNKFQVYNFLRSDEINIEVTNTLKKIIDQYLGKVKNDVEIWDILVEYDQKSKIFNLSQWLGDDLDADDESDLNDNKNSDLPPAPKSYWANADWQDLKPLAPASYQSSANWKDPNKNKGANLPPAPGGYWSNVDWKNIKSQKRKINNKKWTGIESPHITAKNQYTNKKTLEATSPGKFPELLEKVFKTTVPRAGDQASLDLMFRIPLGNTGASINIGFKGMAARGLGGTINAAPTTDAKNENRVEARADIYIGISGKVPGVELGFKASFFIRAGTGNDKNTALAINYGLYRLLSKRSRLLGQFWGHGKSVDDRIVKAEQWAAKSEDILFIQPDKGDQAVIDTGTALGANVKFDAKIAEAEIGTAAVPFNRYNKKFLAADEENYNKKQNLKGQKQNEKLFATAPQEITKATTRRKNLRGKMHRAFAIKGKLNFGGLAVSGSYTHAGPTKDGSSNKLKSVLIDRTTWELAANVDVPFVGDQSHVPKTTKLGVDALKKLLKIFIEKRNKKDNDNQADKSNKGDKDTLRQVAAGIEMVTNASNHPIDKEISKAVNKDAADLSDKDKKTALKKIPKRVLRFTISGGLLGSGATVVRFSVDEVSSVTVDVGVVKVDAKKSTNVLTITATKASGAKNWETVKR